MEQVITLTMSNEEYQTNLDNLKCHYEKIIANLKTEYQQKINQLTNDLELLKKAIDANDIYIQIQALAESADKEQIRNLLYASIKKL